jgi:hypothetical protein
VTLAFFAGDRAALARGLERTESVVVTGAAQVTDGALVRVVP